MFLIILWEFLYKTYPTDLVLLIGASRGGFNEHALWAQNFFKHKWKQKINKMKILAEEEKNVSAFRFSNSARQKITCFIFNFIFLLPSRNGVPINRPTGWRGKAYTKWTRYVNGLHWVAIYIILQNLHICKSYIYF